jgi:hypothetical protein
VNGAPLAQKYGCAYLVSETIGEKFEEFKFTVFDTRPDEVKEQEMRLFINQGKLDKSLLEYENGRLKPISCPAIEKWLKPKKVKKERE